MKTRFLYGAALALGLSFSQAAFANVHNMKIVEVYPGSANATDAQYVVLQMFSGGQNKTKDTAVHILDNNNILIQKFVFANDVASGANQDRILISTQVAIDLFKQNPAFNADLIMNAVIPLAGGKICFLDEQAGIGNQGLFDCVSWGNFANDADLDTGTPFNTAEGLVLGKAMKRNLALSGDPNTLQGTDDTNDSATDFLLGDPRPINNAGIAGASTTCNNGIIDGVESCDGVELAGEDCTTILGDPNAAGLACNADCLGFNTAGCGNVNVCGNGLVEAGVAEQCDDGNVVVGDGCDGACQIENLEIPGCGCNVASGTSPLGTSAMFLLFAAPLFIWRRRSSKK
jgi:cysteine-rich repeat protein